MQQDQNSKQQIVDRINKNTNILVTVGHDPSVDALTAALGLTFMLNKLNKHATAVFSGAIPPAITFLDPKATFEDSVDSLRDFIIALDKEKADRLRYKVEGNVVRVFITPYRTVISEKDLEFSQGDFNVELVIALGVEKKEDLDRAITAHGRILHDAIVMTVNAGDRASELGTVNWNDTKASSLSEMMVSVGDLLRQDLLDEQIATVFLTGIVAATDRFSNTLTAPRVMTMAAQLMAAGANQQLIAAKLEEGHEIAKEQSKPQPQAPTTEPKSLDTTDQFDMPVEQPKPRQEARDGEMQIEHDAPQTHTQPVHDEPAPVAAPPSEPESPDVDAVRKEALAQALSAPAAPTLSVADLHADLEAASHELDKAVADSSDHKIGAFQQAPLRASRQSDWRAQPPVDAPILGGTLNATTSEAEAASREEEASNRNRMLLSHEGPVSVQPVVDMPLPVPPAAETPTVPVFAASPLPDLPSFTAPTLAATADISLPTPPPASEPSMADKPAVFGDVTHHEPTLAEIDRQTRTHEAPVLRDGVEQPYVLNPAPVDVEGARAAVDAALSGALEPVAMPDFEPTNAPLTPEPTMQMDAPLSSLSELPTPPMPDFSTLPPLPAQSTAPDMGMPFPPTFELAPEASQPAAPTGPADPGQFRIPGQ